MSSRLPLSGRSTLVLWAGGPVVLALSLTAAVSVGSVTIPFETVWAIVVHAIVPSAIATDWPPSREAIVLQLRFPRALLAAIAGGGLGVVGAVMQSATRNPLADPYLLGVSAGAALGANLALLHTGMVLGEVTLPLFAFAGALGATVLVVAISTFGTATTADRLVLAGVAVSFVVMALASLLILFGDARAVQAVVFWTLGGFGLAQWSNIGYPLAALVIVGAYVLLKAPELNAVAVGDETATTLGIPVERFRLVMLAGSALLTSALVAFSGVVGFVGLMMPHIARLVVGADNRLVIPASLLFGSIFLLWADVLARTIIAPTEVPIGIITGLTGGLFFIGLLRKTRAT